MRAMTVLLGLALLTAGRGTAQEPAEPPGPLLLDRLVAVVGDRLILASDIALEQALAGRDGRPEPLRSAGSALDALIDAAVIRGLAGDVTIYQPASGDVRARLATLRASWEDPADYERFLRAYGLTEDRLSALLFSRMVVERYVQRAVMLPSEAAGEDLTGLKTRYAAWIADARSRVSIRRIAPWSSEPSAFERRSEAPSP